MVFIFYFFYIWKKGEEKNKGKNRGKCVNICFRIFFLKIGGESLREVHFLIIQFSLPQIFINNQIR